MDSDALFPTKCLLVSQPDWASKIAEKPILEVPVVLPKQATWRFRRDLLGRSRHTFHSLHLIFMRLVFIRKISASKAC